MTEPIEQPVVLLSRAERRLLALIAERERLEAEPTEPAEADEGA